MIVDQLPFFVLHLLLWVKRIYPSCVRNQLTIYPTRVQIFYAGEMFLRHLNSYHQSMMLLACLILLFLLKEFFFIV